MNFDDMKTLKSEEIEVPQQLLQLIYWLYDNIFIQSLYSLLGMLKALIDVTEAQYNSSNLKHMSSIGFRASETQYFLHGQIPRENVISSYLNLLVL